MDEITTGQAVVGGGGALAVLAGAAYRLFRVVKEDRRNDTKENRIDEWSDKLMKRVTELETRVDSMAKERNEALQKASDLEGQVHVLELRIQSLEEDLLKERAELAKVRKSAAKKTMPTKAPPDSDR